MAVGDFNGDNDPDLAVANQFDGTVSVLLGTSGGGGFSGATPAGNYNGSDPSCRSRWATSTATVTPTSPSATCPPARSWCSWAALVAASAARPPSPRDSGVSSVAVGDFNRDGDPDLAVANFNHGRVSVLIGGAGGSFRGPTDFTAGSGSPSIAVGDFNRDGKPDFAVASFNSGTVAVRLNTTVPTRPRPRPTMPTARPRTPP